MMKLRLFIYSSVLLIFLVGCANNNTQEGQQNIVNQNADGEILVEQSSYEQNNQLTNNEIATHLANIASEVPDVKDAAAIVAGPYAVVGIDIDEQSDREQVGTIKYSVGEALKDDPYGKTAVVIADADMMQRFRDMNNKIQQGYPVRGVVEELSEIVGRYMPSFPVPENRPQEPSTNEERLHDSNEGDEMKKIRDEQSNKDKPEERN